jgi:hypothetical protein
MQTSIPSPYAGTLDGIRKITAAEGTGGLYKGLLPLWGRQIPYTMVSVEPNKSSPRIVLFKQDVAVLLLNVPNALVLHVFFQGCSI